MHTHPPTRAETTASKLERLSVAIPAAVNSRDFHFTSQDGPELLSHVSPSFRAQLDSFAEDSKPVTFAEQIARWEQRATEFPNLRFDVVGVSSSVNEYKGTANVLLSMEVTGMGDVVLRAMNELKWKKEGDGVWRCVYVIGLRGSVPMDE